MPESPYSILIVDDSIDYRNLLELYLNDFPCELTKVGDGEDAVEAASENDFDLIIMDIIMPLMDGVDATAAIRLQEEANGKRKTPILALSMEDSIETATDCINAGATRMILKPASRSDLLDVIREMLAP